jgi:Lrp/AsnC family leucine-responsive transcriptional regulator
VKERVRRLRTAGIIDGFSARVRPEKIGLGLTVLVAVRLERHEERGEFLAFVARCPEIQECHHVTGEDDYVLKVRCSGVPRLEALLGSELKEAARGIRTRTTLVLSTVKDSPVLPLGETAAAEAKRGQSQRRKRR